MGLKRALGGTCCQKNFAMLDQYNQFQHSRRTHLWEVTLSEDLGGLMKFDLLPATLATLLAISNILSRSSDDCPPIKKLVQPARHYANFLAHDASAQHILACSFEARYAPYMDLEAYAWPPICNLVCNLFVGISDDLCLFSPPACIAAHRNPAESLHAAGLNIAQCAAR